MPAPATAPGGFYSSVIDLARVTGTAAANTPSFDGYSATISTRPAEKLGAVVLTSKDASNAATSGIRAAALEPIQAATHHRTLPSTVMTQAIDPAVAHGRDG